MKNLSTSLLICIALSMGYTNICAKNSTFIIADFEDLSLETESHKPGNGTDEEKAMTHFNSGSFKFSTAVDPQWGSWSGFGYANETSIESNGYLQQFRNIVGGGVNKSANYCVAFADVFSKHSIQTTHSTGGDTIKGMYITNTAWVANTIINGDGFTAGDFGFEVGDSLMLTIVGSVLSAEDTVETGRITIALADYRNNDEKEHYYINSWEWIDLSSLGKVNDISFQISGSKNGAYGLNTPSYFALDNLGDTCPARVVAKQNITSSIDLSSLTIFNAADASINYDIYKLNGDISFIDINGSILNVGIDGIFGEIIIKATQKGKSDFMRIPLNKTTGCDIIGDNTLNNIWSKNGNIYIECNEKCNVELITPTGLVLRNETMLQGANVINVDNSNKIIIVRITTQNNIITRSVVI